MSLSLPALADPPSTNCPPGAWFCAEAEVQTPQPPAVAPRPPARPPVVVEEEDEAPPAAPPARRQPPPQVVEAGQPSAAPPPVVIYQPVPAAPPTRVIIVTPGYPYRYHQPYPVYRQVRVAPQPPPPVAPRPQWHSEWGLNLRVEGLALGHSAAEGSGMGGVGLSLRYRPVPAFAFDAGLDILTGTDYNGFDRTETPLSLSGMLFLNPRSHAQLYLIAGATYSHAKVRSTGASPMLAVNRDDGGFSAEYSYFGGQAGAGLEFRVSRHFALDIDGLGFVRHRTDDGALPEFLDPKTGQTTKNSGGGLFRGGLSFWW